MPNSDVRDGACHSLIARRRNRTATIIYLRHLNALQIP